MRFFRRRETPPVEQKPTPEALAERFWGSWFEMLPEIAAALGDREPQRVENQLCDLVAELHPELHFSLDRGQRMVAVDERWTHADVEPFVHERRGADQPHHHLELARCDDLELRHLLDPAVVDIVERGVVVDLAQVVTHDLDVVVGDSGVHLAQVERDRLGVVAVDDFINPIAFGVNEAVHKFFAQPRRLVPFAYIENKLFLCQAQWSQRYREMLERAVTQDDREAHAKTFRNHLSISRHLIEQRLWGSSLLVINP